MSIGNAIKLALDSYRCRHWEYPDGDGMALVDLLTPDSGGDIFRGEDELAALLDHIWGVLDTEGFI